MSSYDVAIVGFGPTGATLAKLLARQGRRVLMLERDPEVYALPRAVHFDHEVMRIFQNLGLAKPILEHTWIPESMEFWGAERQVLLRMDLAQDTDQGWRSNIIFHQPSVDRILRDAAGAAPGVEVRLGSELVRLHESAGAVELELRGPDGGSEQVQASWLVGCDGANSSVRRQAGLELVDLQFDEPWVVVDCEGPHDLPGTLIQFCDPRRPTTVIQCSHGRRRFEFMLRPEEEDRDMTRPEELERLIEPWMDPATTHIIRAAVYRFHALVARDWRRGRVLIAGDAAHQTPPFLGQGMCAGIRDAMNLAWKLDRVLRGVSPDPILDSYGSERAPHVREFIERAVRIGGIICTQDPELARQRDAGMLASKERGEEPPIAVALPRYPAGLIRAGEHPKIGDLSPQPWLETASGKQRLDERVGPRFCLLRRRDGDDGELAELDGVSVVWDDGPGRAYFARHDLEALLIRPDRMIYGVATSPEDVPRLVADACAALGA